MISTVAVATSQYQWRKYAGPWYTNIASPILVAEADDGAVIGFYIDTVDGRIEPSFLIETPDGKHFSTDSTEEWTGVEAYVPRDKWPEPMFVGKHGPEERHPDPAITQAIADWRRTDIKDRQTPVVLDWEMPNPSNPEAGVPQDTVTALVPDPENPDDLIPWAAAAGEDIDDTERLLPGDDYTDRAPYEAAEDRLLERLGMTRDDVDKIHVP